MLRISEHYWSSAIFFPRVILYTFSSLFLISFMVVGVFGCRFWGLGCLVAIFGAGVFS